MTEENELKKENERLTILLKSKDNTINFLLEEGVKLKKENKQLKQSNKGLHSKLQIFKEDVTYSNKIINRLNDENNQLKQSNNEAIELILDGIIKMHDGKRDYAETLFNKAIKLLKGDVE